MLIDTHKRSLPTGFFLRFLARVLQQSAALQPQFANRGHSAQLIDALLVDQPTKQLIFLLAVDLHENARQLLLLAHAQLLDFVVLLLQRLLVEGGKFSVFPKRLRRVVEDIGLRPAGRTSVGSAGGAL